MNGPVIAAVAAQAAPLAACVVILFGLRRRPGAAAALAIVALTVALAATAYLVAAVAVPNTTQLATAVWLPLSEGPGLAFGVLLDTLSTTMALVVAAITLAVMIYSLGYMAGDPGFARYYGFLALFGWAMLGLVLASNLLQTLVFWELVGLASFLLIGFWFERPAPRGRRAQGVHHDPGRRRGLPARRAAADPRPGHRDHPRPDRGGRARWQLHPGLHHHGGGAAAHGRHRQERAGAAVHLAPRRDGRPDPRLGPAPLGHHGGGRRLPRGPHARPVRGGARGDALPALALGDHRHRGRDDGHGGERHQAGARLLVHLPARLHADGARRRQRVGRLLPSGDPRRLQGAAVHGRRHLHPSRALQRHARDRRPRAEPARRGDRPAGGEPGALRHDPLLGVLLQGSGAGRAG